jgi:serine/threonine protein kinase
LTGDADEGWIFIVMEYCDRGNVYSAQGQREGGVFAFAECMHMLRSVLEGLRHIHELNLIHRDIKAENILLLTDPDQPYGYRAKICDLGFCREDDDNVNTFCGTTSYMAPEIFRKSVYDNKVDVWAVGVLMFRMLFGDFPFKSNSLPTQASTWSTRSLPNALKGSVCAG